MWARRKLFVFMCNVRPVVDQLMIAEVMLPIRTLATSNNPVTGQTEKRLIIMEWLSNRKKLIIISLHIFNITCTSFNSLADKGSLQKKDQCYLPSLRWRNEHQTSLWNKWNCQRYHFAEENKRSATQQGWQAKRKFWENFVVFIPKFYLF